MFVPKQLAEEALSRVSVAALLHEDIENVSVLADCPPEIVALSADLDEDFIDVRSVAATTLVPTKALRIPGPKCPHHWRIVS